MIGKQCLLAAGACRLSLCYAFHGTGLRQHFVLSVSRVDLDVSHRAFVADPLANREPESVAMKVKREERKEAEHRAEHVAPGRHESEHDRNSRDNPER